MVERARFSAANGRGRGDVKAQIAPPSRRCASNSAKGKTMNKKTVWTIIGGGNGGQSMAGHLALMGFPVRLYDIFPATIDAINAQGGIEVGGVVEGFGALAMATSDIAHAIDGADIVVVVAPATAHREIARVCAPHLCDGQIVIVHPSATGGALEFRKVFDAEGCRAEVAIAETNSLLYACRAPTPGKAFIYGIKQNLVLATLPTRENPHVLSLVQQAFPSIVGGRNVLETSLGNMNAVMHPAPTILNTSLIESRHDWLYYVDGITPTVGAFVEALDAERVALAAAYGVSVPPAVAWYGLAYGVHAPTLSEITSKNPAYAEIKGQKEMRTRYLLEDIPTGLVPMIELAGLRNVNVEHMQLVARFGELLLGEDFSATERTLQSLGLNGLTPSEFDHFIETGERLSGR